MRSSFLVALALSLSVPALARAQATTAQPTGPAGQGAPGLPPAGNPSNTPTATGELPGPSKADQPTNGSAGSSTGVSAPGDVGKDTRTGSSPTGVDAPTAPDGTTNSPTSARPGTADPASPSAPTQPGANDPAMPSQPGDPATGTDRSGAPADTTTPGMNGPSDNKPADPSKPQDSNKPVDPSAPTSPSTTPPSAAQPNSPASGGVH